MRDVIEPGLCVGHHRPELVDRERPTVQADPSLAEKQRWIRTHPNCDGGRDQHWAQHYKPDERPPDVDQPLGEQTDLVLMVVNQRADQEAIEFFLLDALLPVVPRVNGDADGLAFVGRESAERLGVQGGRFGRQTATSSTTWVWNMASMSSNVPRIGRETGARDLARDGEMSITRIPRVARASTRSAKSDASGPVPATSMYRMLYPRRRSVPNEYRR